MSDCQRFQVWLVQLNPTQGREISKTRPCVIVSPDEMQALSTALVAPMTTQGFEFPCRVSCVFQKKQGLILLDHLRAVDKSRLIKNLGTLDKKTQKDLCRCLQEIFAF